MDCTNTYEAQASYMNLDFSGQTALVTGASRGIGEAIARDLASCGAELVVTSTKPTDRDDLESRFGVPTRFFDVDFTDEQSTAAFLTEISALDRVDVCVNNAGTTRHTAIEDATRDDWDVTASVNLAVLTEGGKTLAETVTDKATLEPAPRPQSAGDDGRGEEHAEETREPAADAGRGE